ncbi:MAG TPA: hypothetical protein VD978_11110 [Azospirillum sp.]|nr:hypothetical protein [Azospirillum sp.]
MRSLLVASTLVALTVMSAPGHALDLGADADERAAPMRSSSAPKPKKAAPVSDACRATLRGQTIAIIFEEISNGQVRGNQGRYAASFALVAQALSNAGLHVTPQEDITKAIAAEETARYLDNDVDAAMSAATRLGAAYILRATVQTSAHQNAMIRVKEVSTSITFTMAPSGGPIVATASASGASYSGMNDAAGVARELIGEHIGSVVSTIYGRTCASLKR